MQKKIKGVLVSVILAAVVLYAVEGDVTTNDRLPVHRERFGRDTVTVIIGSPYIGNVIPFWGATYNAARFQVLFLQSEINTAGTIVSFAFMPSSSGFVTCPYYNVHVYFCHTTVTQLSSTFDLNYSGNTPVEVISADTLVVGGAQNVWMDWVVNFDYNNVDNLLVEITWNGDGGTNIALWRTGEAVPRRLYAWDDHAASGSLQNTGNHVRLMIDTGVGIAESDCAGTDLGVYAAPNPFTHNTSISYEVASRASVTLDIYDAAGRCVAGLVDAEQSPGSYRVQWDGAYVENGVYFCRLEIDGDAVVTPIVLLK